MSVKDVVFFASPTEFRAWLEENYERVPEQWVGFHKVGSGTPSITWPEAVDAALCYGWIDGLRKRIDDSSYAIRFTPRKRTSNWSTVNVKRVAELKELGLMRPAGLKAYEERDLRKSEMYSYEQRHSGLDDASTSRLKQNQAAWDFFQSQPPWYQNTAGFWVMSAKKEETRQKRLATLIEDSQHGRRIRPLSYGSYGKPAE